MAEAIARVLEDPGLADALGRAARRRIEEGFSVDRMVEATEQLYVDLLAEKRPGRVVAWST
jgi:glycosyltransferase involved in cell wall biosynthesis